MSVSTIACEMKCARCGRTGHSTQQCELPFYCTKTAADRRAEAAKKKAEWLARQEEKAKKQAEYEAKQLVREEEKAKKQAEYEARQAAWKARKSVNKDCDTESISTEVSTAASTMVVVDEMEVERIAMADKVVRKFLKTLREIEKLEGQDNLEKNQKAKLARKSEIELELDSAKVSAKVRARDTLMRAAIAAC